MTSDSRVDAVLDAIGDLVRDGRSAWEIAQAAIEANDAWLKEKGWKAVPRNMTDPMRSANYSGPITSWQASWDRVPSPEDFDQ